MKTFLKNFIICGIIGWCIEILFTAFHSWRRRDLTLAGKTSIWMFPIYGFGCLVLPVSRLLKRKTPLFRGFCYAAGIFTVEFITGLLLRQHNFCPWDYSRSKWNIKQVIRLDYLPCWIVTGLLFEHVLTGKKQAAEE